MISLAGTGVNGMTALVLTTLFTILLLWVISLLCAPSRHEIPRRLLTVEGGWVTIAVAAVGAVASYQSSRKASQAQAGATRKQIREQGEESRRSAAFEGALADYYQQQGNDRARKSLGNFAKWSTVAPPTTPYYQPTPPAMPDPNNYRATAPVTGRE